jgi:hypothetical protein
MTDRISYNFFAGVAFAIFVPTPPHDTKKNTTTTNTTNFFMVHLSNYVT